MPSLMRSTSVCGALLTLLTFASPAPAAQNVAAASDMPPADAESRYGALAMPLAFAPVTLTVERGAHSLIITAPYQSPNSERTPFSTEAALPAIASHSPSSSSPTDFTAGWRYHSTWGKERPFSVSYEAQVRFDTAADATGTIGMPPEYLVRVELARDIGRFTPRAEVGYRYSPRSTFEPQASRSLVGALGATFRPTDRGSVDLYFDYATPPVAGALAQRSLSLSFAHRVSTRADVAVHAFRSLSEDRAYNAGVRWAYRF